MSPAPGSTEGTAATDLPLAGQRVIVTRPEHQAEPLCRRLSELGADVCRWPLLQIEAIDTAEPGYQALKNIFLDLDNYHSVIFVSANAARFGHDWIDQYWPQLPLGINWLAVGSATAGELQRLGIDCQAAQGKMDSEALLALAQLQRVDGERVLICRGQGGRDKLAQTLIQRGARVELAELYRRRSPSYSAAEIESIIYKSSASAMLVSSGEALSNLISLNQSSTASGNRLADTLLVVPSQRVAELAKQNNFNHIRVAANATDGAMIDVLMDLGTAQGRAEN